MSKKLLTALAAVMALAAFALPSIASADTWTNVDVTCASGPPCEFTAHSTDSVLSGIPGQAPLHCDVVMHGTIVQGGSTSIDTVTITPNASNDPRCFAVTGQNLPWADQLCNSDPGEEYVDTIQASFGVAGIPGTFDGAVPADFGSFPGGTLMDGLSANVNSNVTNATAGITANVAGLYTVGTSEDVFVQSNADPCGS
jgi:hypothetical protein